MIRFLLSLMIIYLQSGFGQTVIIKDSLLNKPITNANISSNSFWGN